MMRLIVSYFCVGSLVAGCIWEGEQPAVDGVNQRLTLLHTSDIHSRLLPYHLAPTAGDRSLGLNEANAPFGGASRLGYLIKRERGRSDRVLHLDSGDCFQGAPIFNVHEGEPEFRFLSMTGLDAAVIGNHEFDAGTSNLAEKYFNWATFDVLAANYLFPDPLDPNVHSLGDVAVPYNIYNLNGLRVAVIGMANLGSLSSIGEGGNSLSITPLEQNETVRAYVNLLHPVVDLVVVLTHLGLDEDADLIRGYEKVVYQDRVHANWEVLEDLDNGRVRVWIPGVRGIDAVLGGHLHVVLNPPKVLRDRDGRDVPIVHSGAFAKFLGRFDAVLEDDVKFGGKHIASFKYQVFPVDDRLAPNEDDRINEMLAQYRFELAFEIDLKRVVGFSPRTILRRSHTGNGDSALGNLVAAAMRWRRRVNAEFSVTNTLGIRDNFYAGPITMEDMFNVFPFENTLVVMYLSGREVQELVDYISERSASRGCQSQAQVEGLEFTMNCAQALLNERDSDVYKNPGEDVLIGGEALRENFTYKVAANDYIARGGSGFKVLKYNTTKIDTGISMRDALVDHIRSLPLCRDYELEIDACGQSDEFSRQLCQEIGGIGRIPGQEEASGPFAEVPCIVGYEDGRIRRKVTLNEADVQPSGEES